MTRLSLTASAELLCTAILIAVSGDISYCLSSFIPKVLTNEPPTGKPASEHLFPGNLKAARILLEKVAQPVHSLNCTGTFVVVVR